MIVPITRKEKLLNAIATNGDVDFVPKTREELFLFKILGADVNTPTPITRKELLYQHIIDGTIPTFEPRTRLEKFIMAAAGVGLELPVVLTREEYWWAEISDSAYETITGAIVHFIAKRARAIKSLIANISYTQDLHGYDSPWPAGGGKNKFNGTFLQGYWAYADGKWVNSPNWITTGKIPCKASTSYTVSADAKATRWQGFVWYDSNGDFISTDNLNSNVNIGLTKTSPSNAAYLIFNIAGYPGANDTIAPSDVTYFQLEEGSSSTAYAPYSNICPISGWTGANVTRTGKNLFDPTTFSSRSNYYDVNDDGSVKIKASDSSGWNSVPIISLKAGTYTVSINDYTSGNYQVETSEDNYTSPTHKRYDAAFTFTLTKDGGIKVKMGTGGATLPQTVKPILNIGYTAASYSPYVGDTYSITFPSEAGTVYGGTLDVTTGKLTVDRAKIVLDGTQQISRENWKPQAKSVGWIYPYDLTRNVVGTGAVMQNVISNALPSKPFNALQSINGPGIALASNQTYGISVMYPNTTLTTASAINAFLAEHPIDVVYELATPQTYQLTPTEVTTLLGDNTIWADTGDVSVTY